MPTSNINKITNREIAASVAGLLLWESNSAHSTYSFEGFGIAADPAVPEHNHLTEEQKQQLGTSTYIVYSYKTPVAWVLKDGTLFVDDHKYSVTTSKLQGFIRQGARLFS